MKTIVTSAPAKIILCGDHGVNRQQPAIATTVDMRTFCRVDVRSDHRYSFRSGERYEEFDREQLLSFRAEIDALRRSEALDDIRERSRDFFAPTRYVLAQVVGHADAAGIDIQWRSSIPVSSGLGSGASASTSMALGALQSAGREPTLDEVVQAAWQGDVIAHGGIASSLDSSIIAFGGLIEYTLARGSVSLPVATSLPLVIGEAFVTDRSTAKLNTTVRKYLEARPAEMHLFGDMGYLVAQVVAALKTDDLVTIGHLFNLHQLIQNRIGTSAPENELLLEAALGAGAMGAKISGAGGGGIIIAVVEPDTQAAVAAAINAAGGRSHVVATGTPGVRVEPVKAWGGDE